MNATPGNPSTVSPARRREWFTPAMLLVAALAWIYPEGGARGGPLHPEIVVKWGVAAIFVLCGLNLPLAAMRSGALHWRLHLLVQGMTFLVIPVFGTIAAVTTKGFVAEEIGIGLVFLCALPSTVSSSIVLTAAARGNVAGAVFNATLSSLLSVFLTPLWLGLYIAGADRAIPVVPVIVDLAQWMLLPMAIGQVGRLWFADWAARQRSRLQILDRLVILLLIYASLCDSVLGGLWSDKTWSWLAVVSFVPVVLLALAMGLSWQGAKRLQLSFPDRITVLFCGSQKSLVVGAGMANLLFAETPIAGAVIAPVMIYHGLQLIVSASLAERWGGRP